MDKKIRRLEITGTVKYKVKQKRLFSKKIKTSIQTFNFDKIAYRMIYTDMPESLRDTAIDIVMDNCERYEVKYKKPTTVYIPLLHPFLRVDVMMGLNIRRVLSMEYYEYSIKDVKCKTPTAQELINNCPEWADKIQGKILGEI